MRKESSRVPANLPRLGVGVGSAQKECRMMSAKRRNTMLTVCIALATCVGIASADWVTATVPVGSFPSSVALNPVTNKVYIGNEVSDYVTVIDGATDRKTTVIVGNLPYAIAVNPGIRGTH